MFSIFFALSPNLNVPKVYSNYEIQGLMHKITQVLELPPKEERRIFVKGEFL